MKLYALLELEAPGEVRRVVFVAMVAGLSEGLVLATLNSAALSAFAGGQTLSQIALYIIGLVVFLAGWLHAMGSAGALVERIIGQYRVRVARRLLAASIATFERISPERLMSTYTRDSVALSECALLFTSGASNLAFLAFALLYLGTVSGVALVAVAAVLALAVLVGLTLLPRARWRMQDARLAEERFLGALGQLTGGQRELKLASEAQADLLEHFRRSAAEVEERRSQAVSLQDDATTLAQALYLSVVVLLVVALPTAGLLDAGGAFAITSTLVFSAGPLEAALMAAARIERANDAVEAMAALEAELGAPEARRGEPPLDALSPVPPFERLSIEGLVYAFPDGGFRVGPMSFELKRGECVFVVGHNGSGKTTFLKLLTGLYAPAEGRRLLNGEEVTTEGLSSYRRLFSVVMANPHLFDVIYGELSATEDQINARLDHLGLAGKTRLLGRRMQTLALSTGQRKRVALALALSSPSPILVFDELAADQDPPFRERFYREILPELKAEGWTIVAVTHDTRYFSVADRVVELKDGRVARASAVGG